MINLNDFHFLRPELLWLFIPALALIYKLKQNTKQSSDWSQVISPHLLDFLFTSGQKKQARSIFWLTPVIILLTILAISGPAIRQKPVPVFETENAQVVLLDLSLSMDATDVKPTRLERAKFKLLDLLKNTREGTVALVVYAGESFVISPLTSDANTIISMVPMLSTGIMPVLGSRPDLGIKKSIELLKNAKYNKGQIIWLTDGVDDSQIDSVISSINQSKYNLSILAVGTEQGSPIPLKGKNGFLKDKSGAIVVPKLQSAALNQIAEATSAGITQLSADDSDIEYLSNYQKWQIENNDESEKAQQSVNRWIDDGYWLIWLIIVFYLFKLIKQPPSKSLNSLMLVSGVLILTGFTAQPVNALSWQDLWLTQDQQGNQAFQKEDFKKAAELYKDKNWQAAAQYKNGDFADAAKNFSQNQSVQAQYNRATSLAKANKLKEALEIYNELLKKSPEHEDAKFNKKLIEDLMKQQEQQKQKNQQNKEQNSDKENKDSKNSEPDSQEQKDQENKDAEKNSENKQQEQQDAEKKEEQSQQNKDPAENKEQQEMEISKDEREKSEKDQELEHWLEKIPDDPGGLLRRKMYREYQRRGRQQKEEKLW